MSNLKKIKLIVAGAFSLTLVSSLSFVAPARLANIAGIAVAHAAGPNNGSNNPGKCKTATNPKCTVVSPS